MNNKNESLHNLMLPLPLVCTSATHTVPIANSEKLLPNRIKQQKFKKDAYLQWRKYQLKSTFSNMT